MELITTYMDSLLDDGADMDRDLPTLDNFVHHMVKGACHFVAFHHQMDLNFFKYSGTPPIRFHPTRGDMIIFKEIMKKEAKNVPKDQWCEGNAYVIAARALFIYYYPHYDLTNRVQLSKS